MSTSTLPAVAMYRRTCVAIMAARNAVPPTVRMMLNRLQYTITDIDERYRPKRCSIHLFICHLRRQATPTHLASSPLAHRAYECACAVLIGAEQVQIRRESALARVYAINAGMYLEVNLWCVMTPSHNHARLTWRVPASLILTRDLPRATIRGGRENDY
eukprot:3018454-Pleurochrysis_carterae.AAC.1